MRAVEVDLADDRFDIVYDAGVVTVDELLATIRALGYEPVLVDAPKERVQLAASIDRDALPQELRGLFDQARKEDKPLLVEFSGPG